MSYSRLQGTGLSRPNAKPDHYMCKTGYFSLSLLTNPADDTINDTIIAYVQIDDILAPMKENPGTIISNEFFQGGDHFFREPRQSGSSHRIYTTPWQRRASITKP